MLAETQARSKKLKALMRAELLRQKKELGPGATAYRMVAQRIRRMNEVLGSEADMGHANDHVQQLTTETSL